MSEPTRRDVEAALAAGRALGPDYTDHLAAGLAERMEQLAAVRAAELRHERELVREQRDVDASGRTQSFVLGMVSLGAGIPITAISGGYADLAGIAVSWVGIVGVNLAHTLWRRRPPDQHR